MRSTDEQMRIVRERADRLRSARLQRRHRLIRAASLCFSLALIVVMSLTFPAADGAVLTRTVSPYGSLLQSSPALGYVVIGAVGFVLGVCVTLLSVRLAQQRRNGSSGK